MNEKRVVFIKKEGNQAVFKTDAGEEIRFPLESLPKTIGEAVIRLVPQKDDALDRSAGAAAMLNELLRPSKIEPSKD